MNTYEGHWHRGQREGHGVFTYASGASYNGEWEANLKHGIGTFTSDDNQVPDDNASAAADTCACVYRFTTASIAAIKWLDYRVRPTTTIAPRASACPWRVSSKSMPSWRPRCPRIDPRATVASHAGCRP